jgi:phosphoribosylformylglycinamidine synthase
MIWGVIDAIEAGHVAACQDISDGGLGVALAEMALGGFGKGNLGVSVNVTGDVLGGLRADKWLLSESGGFVIEVHAGHESQVREVFADHGVDIIELGEVTSDARFRINIADELSVDLALDEVRRVWSTGLAEALAE